MKGKLRLLRKRLCVAGLVAASVFAGVAAPVAVSMAHAEDAQAATGNEIVNYARQFKGYRYVYGTAGPNTFDCSGLVKYVFGHFGINLPHSSTTIFNNPSAYGTVVGTGSTANAQPGDLISWNGHIAIYSGNGYCVEALNPSQGVGEWTVASHTNGNNYKVIRVYGISGDTQKPTNARAEQNQVWYDLKDTIRIKAYADNATYYEICIDDSKANRIVWYQPMNGNEYSIQAKDLGRIDDYVFTIIAKNSAGAIQSAWYKIPVCGKPGYSNIEASKSIYHINDTVKIKVDTIVAKGQVIGIDRDNVRVITQDCPDTYSISASKLGVGDYSAYFSVYNGSGSIDTKRVYFKITDIIPVENVVIPLCMFRGNNNLTCDLGESINLSAAITPSNATNKNVSYSSSNPSVAKVDSNGKVTALKSGTATITVKAEDNGKTASCTVTVKAKDTRTGVYYVNNEWVYLKNGQKSSYTGVAKSSSGNWVFVRNGVFDTNYSGVARSTTGNWVYVRNGRYYTGYTGVARSTTGNWVYVRNGRYYTGYTGVARSTTGNWVYVIKGRFDLQAQKTTGVARSTTGNFVYVKNGRYYTIYTGLAKSLNTGALVYVKNGRYYTGFNGKAYYNGKAYTVKNGRV